MTKKTVDSSDLPGLYQSSNQASLGAQANYFNSLKWYLLLLILAAFVSYIRPNDVVGALLSASLFLITLGILIFNRVKRPDDTWYNGRAVAESVKTISWRWMMKAEPYDNDDNIDVASGAFIGDLKSILKQNKSLSHSLQAGIAVNDPVSEKMREVRLLSVSDRLQVYVEQRIKDQADWYWLKSQHNKRRAQQWFWVSVALHSTAILILLYRIKDPTISVPVEVVATAASAALTWLQAKKHNELNSAYALTAHEIVLIKGESTAVHTERQLSDYVVSSESAFSREHTQWVARKGD